MSSQTSFELASLSVVKPGIHDALSVVSARLVQYLDAPALNASALQEARSELHRIQGVLRMIRLDGVAVYCAEIERVLAELAANASLASLLYRNVLQRALTGLTDYLDSLMQGADNASLALFPKYEAMQHLRGMEMSFEQDLFFPNLAVKLPDTVLNIVQADNAAALIKSAHSQYQRGLMLWLQNGSGGFPLMQQALDTVLSCVPQNNSRDFWWIANGLLDCLELEGLPMDLSVRKLFGRIERQMRAVAKADSGDVQPIINEMLYLIGCSEAASERAEQVKQYYALEQYYPALPVTRSVEDKKSYEELRDQMQEAEDNWEQCVAGDEGACNKFVEYIEKIAKKSDKLERNTPHYLTKKIQALSDYLRDPAYARLIGEDVAMALMLWRSGMTQYESVDTRFQEQARILSDQIHAAMNHKPEDAQRIAELIRLYSQTEQGAVTSSLANEMLANLQLVEQGLNTFFGDVTKRCELTSLQRLLVQIHGGLHILSLKQAEQLLVEIQTLIRYFADGEAVPRLIETQALAGAVSALHEYVQHLANGQSHHTKALLAALNELNRLRHGAQIPAPPSQTPAIIARPAPVIQRPIGEDRELLEIFLEEAKEVLGIMRDNVEISHLHPEDLEPLITMRRGFHTLKGSGRMVGLIDLGEVAWASERALQKRVQDKKAANPALLNFISDAIQAFSGWVDDLERQGYVSIEARALIALARQIESGVDAPEQGIPEAVISEPVTPEAVISEPVTPEAVIPEAVISEAVISEAVIPEAAIPEAVTPEAVISEPVIPEAVIPEAVLPEAVLPEAVIPEPVIPEPAAEPEHDFAEPESVVIGEIAVSPTLFKIASEEASQNVLALHRQLEELMAASPVQYDFMRAAHTLAGICRSLGFLSVVELAAGLEGWLQTHIDMPVSISKQQLHLLQEVIAALDEMVQDICAKKMPQKHDDLVQRLLADKHQVISEYERLAQPGCESGEIAQTITVENSPAPATDESARSRPAAAPEQKMILRDDVDAQLLPIFLEETDELCPKIGSCLRTLRQSPEDEPQLLNRLLHTLKGSARMTGAMRIGDITHAMEDRLLADDRRNTALWDALDDDFDHINVLLEELRTGKIMPELAAGTIQEAGEEAADTDQSVAQQSVAEHMPAASMLRVRSDVVDRLVNQAGEISVARSRMETELRAFKEGLLELTGSVTRLRKQLREVEIQAESQMQARVSLSSESNERFDPLEFDRFTRLQELTRFMDESVHDVQTVQQSLLKNIDETSSVIFAQARLNRDLQQSLMSVRMVPFGSMSERLYRLVRQTAKELNKRVNLELTGTGVELDRSMLEKMAAPFDHLLRNAIAHGLEDERLRTASGKDAIGEIRLGLRQENNEVVFEFSDDGGGLDFAALRAEAVRKGLLEANNYKVSDDQLAQLIFASGISTASEVTEVAGRGIGMDVVRSEIASLGGRIDVSSRAGQGTHFTIHLPLTLAVTQVLMVRAGEATYAIPSNLVEQVRQVKPAVLKAVYAEQKVEWESKTYPLQHLPALLGDDEQPPESQPHNPLLLLRSGNQRIALHVDELLGNKEAVVKNIGPQLARLPGIAGASVLGDGSVVLILNPVQMIQRIGIAAHKIRRAEPVVLRAQPLIMVVDDSLTVRKITTRLLTRAGYQVITAKDGVDALEQLTEITPDVMLLDVEMPRMDGFELTKLLRRDVKTQNLPIIMITSRTADKHRNFALQLGVNAYLGKPYQEDELLEQIAGYLLVPEAA